MAKRKKPVTEETLDEMPVPKSYPDAVDEANRSQIAAFAAYRAEPFPADSLPKPEHVIGVTEAMAVEIKAANTRSPIKNERMKAARAKARGA